MKILAIFALVATIAGAGAVLARDAATAAGIDARRASVQPEGVRA